MKGADQARCLNDSLRFATLLIPLINVVKNFYVECRPGTLRLFDDCLRPRVQLIPLINAGKLDSMKGADQARCLNDGLRPGTRLIPLMYAVKQFE